MSEEEKGRIGSPAETYGIYARPACKRELELRDGGLQCHVRAVTYPILDGIPDFIVENSLASKSGEHVMHRLEELKEKHALIGDIRGKGLMIGVELVKNRDSKKPAAEVTSRIRHLCREKGVLVGHGGALDNVIRIQPGLIISLDQLDLGIDTIDEAMSEVVK